MAGDRRGQGCRGQSPLLPRRHLAPSPAGTPRPGQAQPQGPPASATLHRRLLGTGRDELCHRLHPKVLRHPVPAPVPATGCAPVMPLWHTEALAAMAPAAAFPPAPQLRCQRGTRLLFPKIGPRDWLPHDFFMAGLSLTMPGGCRSPPATELPELWQRCLARCN